MRLHQWLKNTLVFIPLAAVHRFDNMMLLLDAFVAFVAMGLVASSGYLVNDLIDIQADRAHPRKRSRPFASGALAVSHGVVLVIFLFVAGVGLAAVVSWLLAVWLVSYFTLSFAYSVWLKRKVLIDVFILAVLYTHRILTGSISTEIPPSFWLLALSMFIFLSLAMLKRYSELVEFCSDFTEGSPMRRDYRVEDLPLLGSFGTAAGFSSVFVLALYIDSEKVRMLYLTPELLWLCCPLLLYWISRMWICARRGVMNDDPLVFALHDHVSLVVFGLMLLLATAAATIDLRCVQLGCS